MPSEPYYLVSHHNTVLYVDYSAQRLRHAPFGIAPLNLQMESIDLTGRFIATGMSAADAAQLSVVHRSGLVRAQTGGAHMDCHLIPTDDRQVAIRIRDQHLSAEPDGIVRCDRDWYREWEHFLPVRADTLASLVLLHSYAWLSKSDGQRVSLSGRAMDFRQELQIGPANVRLDSRTGVFILERGNITCDGAGISMRVLGLCGANWDFMLLPSVRSFDLFDTLLARRRVDSRSIFRMVEHSSGYSGFAAVRIKAEEEISQGDYTLDDIYDRLVVAYGMPTGVSERLKALELDMDYANLFKIAEHCCEVTPNDVVVSDMYLPRERLLKLLLDKCDVKPRELFVSAHGKRRGVVWGTIRREIEIIEHLGDNAITDFASAEAAGISARLTKVSQRTPLEEELADSGFEPLSNLIREARLTSWSADPTLRQAQIAQVEVNFPLLFLTSLHLYKLATARGWDNILMSARDCYLWQSLYSQICAMLPNSPSSAYFYTSRRIRARPSPGYLAYFAHLRIGGRNVVVDLDGTGWSLSRLIEQAPEPSTEIFIFHKLDAPGLLQQYEQYGPLGAPLSIHSIVARASNCSDHSVLEYLNRAPHPLVLDVRLTQEGFSPVFAPLEYSAAAKALIRAHHAAFDQARSLLTTIEPCDFLNMMSRETDPMITSIYGRMRGMLPDLKALGEAEEWEERLLWDGLKAGGAG